MKPILLAGSSLLVLSSCSITQESPVNIKGLSNVLSSTASQELQRAGEEACRKAGYSNFSSNILVFSTDVSYHFISGCPVRIYGYAMDRTYYNRFYRGPLPVSELTDHLDRKSVV